MESTSFGAPNVDLVHFKGHLSIMNKNDCPQHANWLRKYLTVNYYTYTVEPPINGTRTIENN